MHFGIHLQCSARFANYTLIISASSDNISRSTTQYHSAGSRTPSMKGAVVLRPYANSATSNRLRHRDRLCTCIVFCHSSSRLYRKVSAAYQPEFTEAVERVCQSVHCDDVRFSIGGGCNRQHTCMMLYVHRGGRSSQNVDMCVDSPAFTRRLPEINPALPRRTNYLRFHLPLIYNL